MSYYEDKLTGTKTKYYDTARLIGSADYSGESMNKTKLMYNFKVKQGMLTESLGLTKASSFGGRRMRYVTCFRRYDQDENRYFDQMVGVSTLGEFLYYDPTEENPTVHTLPDFNLFGDVNFIRYTFNGTDYLVVNAGLGGFYVWNGLSMRIPNNPKVSRIAIYDNKLFACSIDGFARVKYTYMSSPDGWGSDMTGLLLFNECGPGIGLATMKNYLYVFQESGISRISRIDNISGDYDVSKVWHGSERIYEGSIATCGDEVFFCSGGGLYRFNGQSVKRVLHELDGYITPDEKTRSCFYRGKLYIATRAIRDGEGFGAETSALYHNNVLVIYEPETGKFELIRGVSISDFCVMPDFNRLLVVVSGYETCEIKEGGYFLGETLYKSLECTATDLGSHNKKIIKGVRMGNNVPVELTVTVDGVESFYEIPPGAVRFIRLQGVGYHLSFNLKTVYPDPKISLPVFVYSEEVEG